MVTQSLGVKILHPLISLESLAIQHQSLFRRRMNVYHASPKAMRSPKDRITSITADKNTKTGSLISSPAPF